MNRANMHSGVAERTARDLYETRISGHIDA